jgi:hypothetical protein
VFELETGIGTADAIIAAATIAGVLGSISTMATIMETVAG